MQLAVKDIIEALTNSLNLLKEDEKKINELNVFPVPDGDTGTNMRLTLEAGVNAIKNETEMKKIFSLLSVGMLNGARGNSGVILSMFFKGFCKYLKEYEYITPNVLLESFKSAKEYVYKKMKNPVEGTILTVFRCSLDIDNPISFKDLFERMHQKMEVTLANTPKMLKILEDAHVVDAGGAGLVSIIAGILSYINNENIASNIKYTQKVKIKYYNELEHKPIAYITYCVGSGIKQIYSDLGADVILECPNTINPSASEIETAIRNTKADYIVILPNNNNAILTTQMAIKMSQRENVYILETKSMAEGYFALSMMVRTSDNFIFQFNEMKEGLEGVISIDIVRAIKSGNYQGTEYNKGDTLIISSNKIINKTNNFIDALSLGLNNFDLEEKEIIAIFVGKNVTEEEKEEIEEFLEENYCDLEFGILDGNFDNVDLIIGIS